MGPAGPSHLQLVGHQDDGLPPEHLLNALLKDVLPDMGVHGRQQVIQQVDLMVQVDGLGQADPLPLPPREVEALLPDLQTRAMLLTYCPPPDSIPHPAVLGDQELPEASLDSSVDCSSPLYRNPLATPVTLESSTSAGSLVGSGKQGKFLPVLSEGHLAHNSPIPVQSCREGLHLDH